MFWTKSQESEPLVQNDTITGPRSVVGLRVGRSWVRIPSVMCDFSALAGSYPEMGVLWPQWGGWNHTLQGCVFKSVALIT